ncbi:FecCD family ABC transporter permease [Bifidobacterium polysaccharolyticum]|uniref:FecCD family ABC transporter permease n=1 Tax=Bifidobacterium polysaccharolyticum TaxID=2750967 RepID=UPI00061F3B10|nr:ABC transporter, permease protein, putative Coelichelin uptake porter (Iron Chelate Uptake) [Bifidobacterium asteroides]
MDACLLHDSGKPDAMTDLQRIRRAHAIRSLTVTVLLVILLVALALADLALGHRVYSMSDLLGVVWEQSDEGTRFVILQLRMPRTLIGCVAGIAFGMAGIGFQHLLRNMMASPDIIGITAGANTAAIFGIVVLGLSGMPLACLAVMGGLLTALLVMALAWRGSFDPTRLILIGIGVAAGFNALGSWLMIRSDQWDIQAATRWLTGSLADAQWTDLPILATTTLLGATLLLALDRNISTLQLGPEMAAGLGVRVSRVQFQVIIVGVLLLSVATATTGPISFVSFLSGPIATVLVGRGASALIQSGLVGGCLVLGSDIVAQHLPSAQVPVGIITSIVGGPVLIAIMVLMTRRQEL